MAKHALNLVVIQDNPTLGDIDGNADIVLQHLFFNRDVDLIVFPECFISGYPLQDLVLRRGYLSRVEMGLDRIREEVMRLGGPAILIGSPLPGSDLPVNAAVLIEPSGAKRVITKTELPNADVFDERRVFSSNTSHQKPLLFRGFEIGVMICEDMWHANVARSLSGELAEVLIVLNGSPYQRGKQRHRQKLARLRSRETGLPLIYANLVGGQDELVFDGGSFAHDPQGGGIWELGAMRPGSLKLRLERSEDGVQIKPGADVQLDLYPANPVYTDYLACVLGLRDYVKKTGMERVILGVSGGVDSALVATMAVDALGAENVIGVMMPSEHTSQASLDLADELMDRLGVEKQVIAIKEDISRIDSTLSAAITDLAIRMNAEPTMGTTRENLQSRLRGLILMGLSNALGGIVLSTGNKSELAVGYSTLYGDMNGGFNPIKSVYKSDVFSMCRLRNTLKGIVDVKEFVFEPIPEEIITRPPSAELATDQKDADSLGDYELLDLVLKSLIEEREGVLGVADIINMTYPDKSYLNLSGGLSPADYAAKIARLVRFAQYKRDQAPIGVKVGTTDFGLGWRYPIAGHYQL